MHKYKYFKKILKYLIHHISRMYEAACMQISINLQSVMVVQWINSSMNSYVVELPAILDTYIRSLFHKVVNTTSNPYIGMKGGDGG